MTEIKYDIGGGKEIIAEYDENGIMEITRECFEALIEKQIPKKVKKENWIDTKCKCGYCFSKSYPDGYYDIPLEKQTKYCPNCGQKIDWEKDVGE